VLDRLRGEAARGATRATKMRASCRTIRASRPADLKAFIFVALVTPRTAAPRPTPVELESA
jgi:hypothetical protein